MANIVRVNYLKLIRQRIGFITILTLFIVFISLVLTLIQPFEYQSQVKILVIQKTTGGIDAYSASKSAERIGRNLTQVVYSSNFLNKVINYESGIDNSYFPVAEDEKREFWQKMIVSEVPSGTTIINLDVYHQDPTQATLIANSVAQVLIRDVEEYIGLPDVELKVVDEPLTSNYPTRPNVVLNVILGLVVGFFFSLAVVLISYTEKVEIKDLYRTQERKQQKQKSKNKSSYKPVLPDIEQALHLESPKKKNVSHEIAKQEQVMEENGEEKARFSYEKVPEFSEEDEIKTMYKD